MVTQLGGAERSGRPPPPGPAVARAWPSDRPAPGVTEPPSKIGTGAARQSLIRIASSTRVPAIVARRNAPGELGRGPRRQPLDLAGQDRHQPRRGEQVRPDDRRRRRGQHLDADRIGPQQRDRAEQRRQPPPIVQACWASPASIERLPSSISEIVTRPGSGVVLTSSSRKAGRRRPSRSDADRRPGRTAGAQGELHLRAVLRPGPGRGLDQAGLRTAAPGAVIASRVNRRTSPAPVSSGASSVIGSAFTRGCRALQAPRSRWTSASMPSRSASKFNTRAVTECRLSDRVDVVDREVVAAVEQRGDPARERQRLPAPRAGPQPHVLDLHGLVGVGGRLQRQQQPGGVTDHLGRGWDLDARARSSPSTGTPVGDRLQASSVLNCGASTTIAFSSLRSG